MMLCDEVSCTPRLFEDSNIAIESTDSLGLASLVGLMVTEESCVLTVDWSSGKLVILLAYSDVGDHLEVIDANCAAEFVDSGEAADDDTLDAKKSAGREMDDEDSMTIVLVPENDSSEVKIKLGIAIVMTVVTKMRVDSARVELMYPSVEKVKGSVREVASFSPEIDVLGSSDKSLNRLDVARKSDMLSLLALINDTENEGKTSLDTSGASTAGDTVTESDADDAPEALGVIDDSAVSADTV